MARRLRGGCAVASLRGAAAALIAQRDYKRMLADSSIEHMGLLALGAAIGGPLATTAVLLHMLGHGLAKLYEDFFRFPELHFVQSQSLVLSAFLISAVAACLGALGALQSVVALPSAEAMRPATPARFRPGFAERLGLLVTGSSDYHGEGKLNRLGEFTTAADVIDAIEQALARAAGRLERWAYAKGIRQAILRGEAGKVA